jgi:hypothetical protein
MLRRPPWTRTDRAQQVVDCHDSECRVEVPAIGRGVSPPPVPSPARSPPTPITVMNALIFGLKLLDALGAVLFLPVDGSAGSPWDCEVPVPETGDSEELSSALGRTTRYASLCMRPSLPAVKVRALHSTNSLGLKHLAVTVAACLIKFLQMPTDPFEACLTSRSHFEGLCQHRLCRSH